MSKRKNIGLTDFNDLSQSRGLDEVKRQVGLGLQKGIGRKNRVTWANRESYLYEKIFPGVARLTERHLSFTWS